MVPKTKGRPKGTPKTGGRKAGTPNKSTQLNKEMLQKFAEGNWPAFEQAFQDIESPKDQCAIFLRVLEFLMPKMASVEMKSDGKTPDWVTKLEELRRK